MRKGRHQNGFLLVGSCLFEPGSLVEGYRQTLQHSLICVWVLSLSGCVQLFETLRTSAHQAPLSMGFSRQEHWSGFPCFSPKDLLDPGTEPVSPMSPASVGGFFTTSATWEAHRLTRACKKKITHINKICLKINLWQVLIKLLIIITLEKGQRKRFTL